MEMGRLKRQLDKIDLRKEARLRAIPRAGERERQKRRLADVRRRKREKILENRDSINEKSPSWHFVYQDGDYYRVFNRKRRARSRDDLNCGIGDPYIGENKINEIIQ
jgi:hypothetical protein